jgi:hypothetical protein
MQQPAEEGFRNPDEYYTQPFRYDKPGASSELPVQFLAGS